MSTKTSWWQALDLKQRLKLVIYALLLVNFAHYIGNDIEQRATYLSFADGAGMTGPANFATTLDELGWFMPAFSP